MIALSRKERDRKLRRADILKAAEHLFALKGYHKATIRDIAKEAQYATGTVYLHFKDKGDLYLALLEGRIKDLLGLFKEGVSSLQ
ncbi:MAG: helix-turn-helix domain containing protein, partial [Candidatus Omnitrophica bacterium]|nr:helix-turn-helix domain containing protein [Candidatus Omnitrophota bacterium]